MRHNEKVSNFTVAKTVCAMLVRSKAGVLPPVKYNDASVVVETYTEAEGRVAFLVRVPKTRRAAVKSVLFSPLALLELEWNARPAAGLQHVRNAKPYVVFASIPYDPPKTCIALFIAEFLCAALKAPQPDEGVFGFVETSVRWLDAVGDGSANFHLVFLLHLSHYLGVRPNFEGYAEGCYFDLQSGRYCTLHPQHGHVLEPAEAALLPKLMRMKYATASRFAFTRGQRRRLLDAINEYYSLHLPSFPGLKSLDVLHEVFG